MLKIIDIILWFAFAAGLVSCRKGSATISTASPPVSVTVSCATLTNSVFYNSYPANTVALKSVELRGQVTGYLTGMFFTEGEKVAAGEKLYEIDRRKYQAAFEESVSNVKIAEENLERVQRDADRYTELSKQDAVAKQLLDNALTDLNNARHRVDAAKSEMIKAKTDYEYSLISAPFGGTIGLSGVKPGALISQGQTLLNTISSDDPMGIDFTINESELKRFSDIMKQGNTRSDTTFRIILPDNTPYPFTGTISVIDRAVDPMTATIKVRLTVPNTSGVLRPGMSCRVRVLDPEAGMSLRIPYKAVQEQLGEFFVFRVNGKKATQVKVVLGPRINLDVVVAEGLNDGDTIAVEGIQKLTDGSVVAFARPAQ
ncbi:MAG TPA: efflux RND transporter periplasmic adaptor subunit [Bacteroidales bacterium]|jgi:membrane fusion protein (multidrug efflux system)|nr:efflux RND transporter periplasmic adaptor subunit [Bacteroidales bacterium]